MKKTVKLLSLSLILILLFSSCQSSKSASKKAQEEKADRIASRYISAEGTGGSKEEAELNAKWAIAAIFDVTEDSPSFVFPIFGTEILSTTESDGIYTTVARIDRKFTETLYRNELKKLSERTALLYEEIKDKESETSLYDIWKVNEAQDAVNKILAYLPVATLLNEDLGVYADNLPSLEELALIDERLAHDLSFGVRITGQNDADVYGNTLIILNERGFTINNRNPRYSVIINVEINETELVRSTLPYLRYDLDISILDNMTSTVFIRTNYSGNIGGDTASDARRNLQAKLREIISSDFSEIFDYAVF